jgi:hypothetical protein
MKSLALCSNDFYNNIPDWLATYETTSYISGISNFNSIISSIANTYAPSNIPNYEEYVYNTSNLYSDLLNTNANAAAAADANAADAADAATTNINNLPISTISAVNPSNNFLLYYYVEYM